MLSPKKMKYRKQMKGRMKGQANSGNKVTYGEFGLQATTCGFVTARQIESARITISRTTKRGGQVFIKIFPDKPLTKKPAEVRQGKGKGAVDRYVAVVKPGRVMFEVTGIDKELCKEALRLAGYKLSVKSKVITKEGLE